MGKVYLVGAGPGAPDLLTLRARTILQRADIVLYDALVGREILAHCPQAEQVEVGKRCGRAATDQRFINKQLLAAAARQETVVRLKGGDPMLFSRAQEEIEALEKAGIDFEIVPGITAALAASAELRIPLTQRGLSRSVLLLTARHAPDTDASSWVEAALHADTAVLYMACGQARHIAQLLLANGKAGGTPVVVVENASLPTRRIYHGCLEELLAGMEFTLRGPALLLLGESFKRTNRSGIQGKSLSGSHFNPSDPLVRTGILGALHENVHS